ncbi:MAG: hypothetical protein JWQ55_6640 [Rhodopila sp.]|jgi:hypothetical protein|nr:hypothetical protein [Rhodopila sp.]
MSRTASRRPWRGLGKTLMANLDNHDLPISTASALAAEHYRAGVTFSLDCGRHRRLSPRDARWRSALDIGASQHV